jgi:hypothetical protein
MYKVQPVIANHGRDESIAGPGCVFSCCGISPRRVASVSETQPQRAVLPLLTADHWRKPQMNFAINSLVLPPVGNACPETEFPHTIYQSWWRGLEQHEDVVSPATSKQPPHFPERVSQ